MQTIRKSLLKIDSSNIKDVEKPINRKIKTIFKIFEPIIFPITIFPFFCRKADIEAANSGKLVPIAIIVNPIISLETFKMDAKFVPANTVSSEPETRINILRIMNDIILIRLSLLPSSTGSGFCLSRCKINNTKKAIKINDSEFDIL